MDAIPFLYQMKQQRERWGIWIAYLMTYEYVCKVTKHCGRALQVAQVRCYITRNDVLMANTVHWLITPPRASISILLFHNFSASFAWCFILKQILIKKVCCVEENGRELQLVKSHASCLYVWENRAWVENPACLPSTNSFNVDIKHRYVHGHPVTKPLMKTPLAQIL